MNYMMNKQIVDYILGQCLLMQIQNFFIEMYML